MPIHLFGNINGTYQPPQMNLLGSAKVQNSNPVRYNETEIGKNNPVVKVNTKDYKRENGINYIPVYMVPFL